MQVPIQLPPLDLSRVATDGTIAQLATRDALQTMYNALQAQALALATRVAVWTAVPYTAGDFVSYDSAWAAAGTWTVDSGDLTDFEYTRIDDLLIVQFALATTSTSAGGALAALGITIPAGYKGASGILHQGVAVGSDSGGTLVAIQCFVDGTNLPGSISLKLLSGNWTNNAVNTTAVRGMVGFRIAPRSGN